MTNFFDNPEDRRTPLALFNAEALRETSEIVFCRNATEVSNLLECGVRGAMTVLGATQPTGWFKALAEHADALAAPTRIVLATGGTHQFQEELVRRLGRHRCWSTAACLEEIYAADSVEGVIEVLRAAQPYPIDGLRRLEQGMLRRLRSLPPPSTMTTGTMASDQVLKLPTDGRVIIVTGFPNHGKTSWLRFVMVHTAVKHSRRWAVFSPEHQPWERFMVDCARTYVRKPFFPIRGIESMTDAELDEAEAFLNEKVTMLVCDAEKDRPTADWLFERGAAVVLRSGVTDFLIDPFNEVDQQRGNMSETDYIGRFLQRCRAFGQRYGCNVWIAAHPAKPPPLRPKEKRLAPGPYDINGSSHWANKADVGITIHNPEGMITELTLWKARFDIWGRRSSPPAQMEFDPIGQTYTTWVDNGTTQPLPLDEG
jgi:twinkle protein